MGERVAHIGENAFCECSVLESVHLPNGLRSIGVGAFNGCSSLRSIVFPPEVAVIPKLVCANCSAIENVRFGEAVTQIDERALANCSSIRVLEFPPRLISLKKSACENCTALESVRFGDALRLIDSNAFYGCNSLKRINVPAELPLDSCDAFDRCGGLEYIEIEPERLWGFCGRFLAQLPAALRYCLERYAKGELEPMSVAALKSFVGKQVELLLTCGGHILGLRLSVLDDRAFIGFVIDNQLLPLKKADVFLGFVKDVECRAILLDYIDANRKKRSGANKYKL